jgi:uncharacterized DUF497 family protein
MGMKFEWDESKNQINIEKHGIDFEDAKGIFDGPMIVCQRLHENGLKPPV